MRRVPQLIALVRYDELVYKNSKQLASKIASGYLDHRSAHEVGAHHRQIRTSASKQCQALNSSKAFSPEEVIRSTEKKTESIFPHANSLSHPSKVRRELGGLKRSDHATQTPRKFSIFAAAPPLQLQEPQNV